MELPTKQGNYIELYDDGSEGRIWVLGDDDLWYPPEGDGGEFGRWPLYPLVPRVIEWGVSYSRAEAPAFDGYRLRGWREFGRHEELAREYALTVPNGKVHWRYAPVAGTDWMLT